MLNLCRNLRGEDWSRNPYRNLTRTQHRDTCTCAKSCRLRRAAASLLSSFGSRPQNCSKMSYASLYLQRRPHEYSSQDREYTEINIDQDICRQSISFTEDSICTTIHISQKTMRAYRSVFLTEVKTRTTTHHSHRTQAVHTQDSPSQKTTRAQQHIPSPQTTHALQPILDNTSTTTELWHRRQHMYTTHSPSDPSRQILCLASFVVVKI